jgi:hypothetical protein
VELQEAGRRLEESFAATPKETLDRQYWAKEVCSNHPCEGEVTEEQARELMQIFFARVQREEDRWLTQLGIWIAALSAVLSVFALWQTHVAGREARSASDRSIRNEARIEQLSEES